MNCSECGEPIDEPTHFESQIEICMRCIRKRIPQINPKVEIKRPFSKLKCVYCLGTIYSYKTKKQIEIMTNEAVTGLAGAHHPTCKRKFIAELERRGYSVLYETKVKKRRTRSSRKKKQQVEPEISSLEDMKKWITKQP